MPQFAQGCNFFQDLVKAMQKISQGTDKTFRCFSTRILLHIGSL